MRYQQSGVHRLEKTGYEAQKSEIKNNVYINLKNNTFGM